MSLTKVCKILMGTYDKIFDLERCFTLESNKHRCSALIDSVWFASYFYWLLHSLHYSRYLHSLIHADSFLKRTDSLRLALWLENDTPLVWSWVIFSILNPKKHFSLYIYNKKWRIHLKKHHIDLALSHLKSSSYFHHDNFH